MKAILRTFPLAILALGLSAYSFGESGADLYKSKGCAACHGSNGAGQTTMGKNLKVPDFASAGVQKQSDAELAEIITKGKGRMPSYDGKLTRDQIDGLVKHIRMFKK